MLMGLGNGAVFKLVPEHFPNDTGTVTGLVGALGGLGGFFPPLLLGVFRDRLGVHLARLPPAVRDRAAAARREPARVPARATSHGRSRCRSPRARRSSGSGPARGPALVDGRAWRRPSSSARATSQHFDAALVGYTFATLFAAFGISYRYAMWLHRPPTRMYWRRGWQAFFSRRALGRQHASASAAARSWSSPPTRYIFRRGRLRGLAHWLIMWGCLLAAAITFPLVWGWIHFETVPGNLHIYRTFVFGIPVQDSRSSPLSPSSSSTGSCGRRSWSSPA